jgi:NAD(P)-dependent dehydrogenase (short-subunit alcohol dehydrogenase family)
MLADMPLERLQRMFNVNWLLSEAASYTTGSHLEVSGGLR